MRAWPSKGGLLTGSEGPRGRAVSRGVACSQRGLNTWGASGAWRSAFGRWGSSVRCVVCCISSIDRKAPLPRAEFVFLELVTFLCLLWRAAKCVSFRAVRWGGFRRDGLEPLNVVRVSLSLRSWKAVKGSGGEGGCLLTKDH